MEFETTTVDIILNEMFKDYLKVKNGTDFETLKHNYAERIVKLFAIPVVSKSLKCDCKHSGSCRYEEVVLETKELCRHKE
jgi:hypothetical protein